MTHAPIKYTLGMAAIGLSALVFTACGNDIPSGAVAKVGDETITQDEFDKWLKTLTAAQPQAGGAAVAPDPPDFKRCVAAKKKQPLPQGQERPSDGSLKKQCQTEYDALKSQVMQVLINTTWIEQEAEEQDVEVSDAEIRRRLEDKKRSAFPGKQGEKQYRQYLKTSGMTEEDVLFQVKFELLQQKLTEKVIKDAKKVTDADVQEYYEKNKQRFAQPERRDLLVVLSKTRSQAEAAKTALEDGQSWKQVTKRYSIDEASKAQGGRQPAVTKGQSEKALDEAIFGAEKGVLEGPVKTQFGWQVFEVSKITPASQQSLDESKDAIRNLLRSKRQQDALDDFVKDFRERYKEDTECAEDFRVSQCNNAPKESTKTGPASGGNPDGTPQEQAPAPESPQQ